ncbi:MAG: hypothetical protein ACJAVW_003385 [Spirosomataceae bacterium]|jgi:hypothetical protein
MSKLSFNCPRLQPRELLETRLTALAKTFRSRVGLKPCF